MVTVITPFICSKYEYIPDTIRSLQDQTLTNIEVIIVNDGCSTPEVQAYFEALTRKDPRFRVLHLQHVGVSAARNTGARQAKADFIFFLDADDLIEPTTLEKLWWALNTNPALSFANGFSVGFGAKNYTWYHGFHEGAAFLKENQVTVTALVRKDVFDAVGGFTTKDTEGFEDWDFWLKCASHGYWGATIPEFTDWYRQRPTRMSDWKAFGDMKSWETTFLERYPALYNQGDIPYKYHTLPPTPQLLEPVNVHRRVAHQRHLLFIVPWMVTGGADRFNLNLLNYLASDGWDITIAATLPWRPKPWRQQDWESKFLDITRDVFILSNFVKGERPMAEFLASLVTSRRPDVVLLSNSELGYASLPLLQWTAQENGLATFFADFNHMHEEEWRNGGYPALSVERGPYLDAHIVSSNYLRSWMVKRGGTPHRIKTCYTGTSPGLRVQPAINARIREELNISKSAVVILYAARVVEQKQPDVLAATMLQLAKAHSNFVLVVAGDGLLLPDLRKDLESIESMVRFMGSLEADRMQEVLQAADIVFLPSKMEGLSLMTFDAMALGKVFVGAEVGGHAEVIPHRCECGYLIQRSTLAREAAEYNAILSLLVSDPELRQSVGEAAQLEVQRKFTDVKMQECMSEIFGSGSAATARKGVATSSDGAMNTTLELLGTLAPWAKP